MPETKNQKKLSIPDWCPKHVGDKARELHRLHSKYAGALIERLATDPRMQRVWDELAKRKRYRRREEPHHKVVERFASAGIDEHAAAAGLLEHAFNNGRVNLLPLSNGADEFKKKAGALRTDVERLEKRMRPRNVGQNYASCLRRAADIYDRIGYEHRDQAKGIACNIAFWLKTVFGSPMYTTTATITSVITGREITDRKVRTWLRMPAR